MKHFSTHPSFDIYIYIFISGPSDINLENACTYQAAFEGFYNVDCSSKKILKTGAILQNRYKNNYYNEDLDISFDQIYLLKRRVSNNVSYYKKEQNKRCRHHWRNSMPKLRLA